MLHHPIARTDPRRSRRTEADGDAAATNPWLRWRMPDDDEPQVLTVAELAECRCPGLCNRDHANE